jgi:hypothetical protein
MLRVFVVYMTFVVRPENRPFDDENEKSGGANYTTAFQNFTMLPV